MDNEYGMFTNKGLSSNERHSTDGSTEIDFLPYHINTRVPEIRPRANPLINDLDVRFLSFGSCFASNIAEVLRSIGMNAFFDFVSCQHFTLATICDRIDYLTGAREHREDDLVENDEGGLFHPSYNTRENFFYGQDRHRRAIEFFKEKDRVLRRELLEAQIIAVTAGTSKVTRLKENDRPTVRVKNVSGERWYVRQETVGETAAHLNRLRDGLVRFFRDNGRTAPHIIITVSPQRYLFRPELLDTTPYEDNTIQKATLRLGVEEFVRSVSDESAVTYFPSYEIVLDELRNFESFSNIDEAHIGIYTPPFVISRFLETYGTPAFLGDLKLLNTLLKFKTRFSIAQEGGLPPTSRQFADPVEVLIPLLDTGKRQHPKISEEAVLVAGVLQNAMAAFPDAPPPASIKRFLNIVKGLQ